LASNIGAVACSDLAGRVTERTNHSVPGGQPHQPLGYEHWTGPANALRSITTWATYQGFQERGKGSPAVGRLADFVILDRNPLKVEPRTLRELKILETIKRGRTIYTAGTTR
jgi:predicted amidohydrolase YtcJ